MNCGCVVDLFRGHFLLPIAGLLILVVLASDIKIVFKAASILLIIAVVIGSFILPGMLEAKKKDYSEEYYALYAELAKEYETFPVDESAGIRSDCKMVYCDIDMIGNRSRYDIPFTNEYIPKKNQPQSPEDTDVIIISRSGEVEIAQYTYGMRAYQQYYTLTVVDVHERTIISEGEIYGARPLTPSKTTLGNDIIGSVPSDKAIKEYIAPLISGDLP